jgi:hypothetical protein
MRIADSMLRPAPVERPILMRVGYRFALYTLLALALCGCDLVTGARASASPSDQLGLPTTAATVVPTASPSSLLTLPSVSPSALASTLASIVPTPSLPTLSLPPVPTPTLPPAFTPTAPPLPTLTVAPPSIVPSPSPTVARATITSFAPEFGLRGALVFINGTGLASTRLVLFGEVAVAPSAPATDTQVTAIVPQAAVTSRISVVTLAGVVTSSRFFTVLETEPLPSPTCPLRVNCLPTPSPSSTP